MFWMSPIECGDQFDMQHPALFYLIHNIHVVYVYKYTTQMLNNLCNKYTYIYNTYKHICARDSYVLRNYTRMTLIICFIAEVNPLFVTRDKILINYFILYFLKGLFNK